MSLFWSFTAEVESIQFFSKHLNLRVYVNVENILLFGMWTCQEKSNSVSSWTIIYNICEMMGFF